MNPWYCCNLDTYNLCIHYITIKISHMDMAYLLNILLIISVNKNYILMSRKGDRKGIWVILKVLLFLWQTFLGLVWSGVASENWLVKKTTKRLATTNRSHVSSYFAKISCPDREVVDPVKISLIAWPYRNMPKLFRPSDMSPCRIWSLRQTIWAHVGVPKIIRNAGAHPLHEPWLTS